MTRIAAFASLLTSVALVVGSPSVAQDRPFSLPPPPSASDPLPKTNAPARTSAPARAARAKKATRSDRVRTNAAADPYAADRTAPSRSSVTDRIDSRGPAGRAMELEDDPRAVQPVMQNGRAGVGMRF